MFCITTVIYIVNVWVLLVSMRAVVPVSRCLCERMMMQVCGNAGHTHTHAHRRGLMRASGCRGTEGHTHAQTHMHTPIWSQEPPYLSLTHMMYEVP